MDSLSTYGALGNGYPKLGGSLSEPLEPYQIRMIKDLWDDRPLHEIAEIVGAGIDIGRINYTGHLTDGMILGASYRYGISTSEGIDNFWQTDLSLYYYKTIFNDMTYAQRLLAGFTTTDVLQYWYYLGELDRIRGFSDNRFAGRYFWLSNSELRVPVWQNDWIVIQTTGFVDIAAASEAFSQLDSIDGASAGLGLRFILPKVYRLTVRLDYAEPIENNDNRNVSFGVQQFF